MKIKQLGNGGGLASALEGHSNSAFLVDIYEDASSYLLFDCGYNTMKRLEEEERDTNFLIANIDIVVISHDHDDHSGNLETLIYWNYFKNQKTMDIYTPSKALFKRIQGTRSIVDNYEQVNVDIFKSLTLVKARDIIQLSAMVLLFTDASHGSKQAVGAILLPDDSSRNIFISGDTKALDILESTIRAIDPDMTNTIAFHDFSNWDDDSKNVHACQTDYKREYSKLFRQKVIKYHTGSKDFNREWQ